MSLPSIPKRAIVSIQPDPYSPFEFMNRNTAENVLNSRHVGGTRRSLRVRGSKRRLANICTFNPGSCRHGGRRKTRRSRTRKN